MTNEHAIHTKNEKIWFDFTGPVPRIGEQVIYGDHTFEVLAVKWFLGKLNDGRTISMARVLVEELTDGL